LLVQFCGGALTVGSSVTQPLVPQAIRAGSDAGGSSVAQSPPPQPAIR
jgi:hypothetical protein